MLTMHPSSILGRTVIVLSCWVASSLNLHAQANADQVIRDWSEWISRVLEVDRHLKIVERFEGVKEPNATVLLIRWDTRKRFHLSHRYLHDQLGWTENFAVANDDYLFALKSRKDKPQLHTLKLVTDPDFESVCSGILEANQLSAMCLLTGAKESVHNLVLAGKISSVSFPNDDSAELSAEVPGDLDDFKIQNVKLAFQRAPDTKWYPDKISWDVHYKDAGRSDIHVLYSYEEWIEHEGIRVPTHLIAKRSNNKSTDMRLSYDLTDEELKSVGRSKLSDFGLPEPLMSESTPMWVWGLVVGTALLATSLLLRLKGK